MRVVFLLLVLGNLAFFAYTRFAEEQQAAVGTPQHLEVSPGSIRLIGPAGGSGQMGKPASPAGPAPNGLAACLEWGIFAGPEIARAQTAIGQLGLTEPVIQRTLPDTVGYWVYMPPQKARADADQKVLELKKLGVSDFYLVQDPPQWRFAISLGIFKTEEAANSFLAGLREKGVRSAVAGRRENFLKHMTFYVREPSPAVVAKLAELQRQFPGTEVRAGACPAG